MFVVWASKSNSSDCSEDDLLSAITDRLMV